MDSENEKRDWRRLDLETIAFVLFMKLFLTAFVIVVFTALSDKAPSFPYGWLERWNQWDAPHYIDIARDGYVTEDLHTKLQRYWIVFYPLYPWTIRAVSFVVRDELLSAHLISLAAAIATALLFRRLVELDDGQSVARSALFFMFVFPTAYFFHTGYSESLFLALTVGCVLAARTNRWAVAGIAGALASLTRVNGLLLIPVMLVEAAMQHHGDRRFRRAWLWILFAFLGFAIYLAINERVWHDPFYFLQLQQHYWGKKLAWPWVGIARTMQFMTSSSAARAQLFGVQELLFVLLGVIGTVWSWRTLRPSYSVWMTLNLLLITSTSVILSSPRYLLTFFPMFTLFARLSEKRPFVGKLITIWSISCLALFAGLFAGGEWAF